MKTRQVSKNEVAEVRPKKRAGSRGIDHLLLPDFLVLCEDYVRGIDNDISIIKTIDFLRPAEIPFTPPRFIVVATFFRLPSAPLSAFAELKPEYRVVIQTPAKKDVEIGPFPVSTISESNSWLVERLIVDLSESIEFTSSGPYTVRVEGRTTEAPFQVTHWRLLPISQPRTGTKKLTRA